MIKIIASSDPCEMISMPYVRDGLHLPKYVGDAGYDIEAAHDTTCRRLEITYVKTGICLHAVWPLWYSFFARSSLTKRQGMIPAPVIDAEYQGELEVPVLALKDDIIIKCGERFAQVVFFNQVRPAVRLTDVFPQSHRGDKGYGSTGT